MLRDSQLVRLRSALLVAVRFDMQGHRQDAARHLPLPASFRQCYAPTAPTYRRNATFAQVAGNHQTLHLPPHACSRCSAFRYPASPIVDCQHRVFSRSGVIACLSPGLRCAPVSRNAVAVQRRIFNGDLGRSRAHTGPASHWRRASLVRRAPDARLRPADQPVADMRHGT